MNVIKVKTEQFYSILTRWWIGQNQPVVSPSMLPEWTYVCFNDSDVPVYSVCFYNTDSHMCWIGWHLGNPFVKKEEKRDCFKYLHDEVEKFAKTAGYHQMFATADNPVIMKTLKECEYEEGDKQVNHYIKQI